MSKDLKSRLSPYVVSKGRRFRLEDCDTDARGWKKTKEELEEQLQTDVARLGQLQEKLYDWSGGEPESNALEVYVHHLRRKIHPGIVRTVRGVGYALGAADVQS